MFTRCAVLVPEQVDPDAAVDAVRAVAAPGGEIVLVGWHRPRFWHIGDMWSAVDGRIADGEAALEARAATLRAEGYRVSAVFHLADDAPIAAVPVDAELVVVPADPLVEPARRWTELLLDAGRTVAWARGDAPPLGRGTHTAVVYVGAARHALPAVDALRARAGTGDRLTLLQVQVAPTLGEAPTAAPDELRALLGWPGRVELAHLPGSLTAIGDLERWSMEHGAHVLAVVVPSAGVLRGLLLRAVGALLRPMPVVWVPDPQPDASQRIDGPDIVRRPDRPLVARLDAVDSFETARRLPDGRYAVVVAGEAIAECTVRDGAAPLPDVPADAGVIGFAAPGAALGALAAAVRIFAPAPGARIALFDAEAPVDATTFAPFDAGRRWWAVRLDPRIPCRPLRAKLAHADGLIDAGAVLEDGDPDDLPADARPLRLARVARHLRASGLAVDLVLGPALIHGAAHCPLAAWNAQSPAERRARIERAFVAPPTPGDAAGALRALTDGMALRATALEVEFDNRLARERLIGLIDGAAQTIDLQIYIFEPDAVGHAVSAALLRALERGVRVRLLVDALFSQHGSLGQTNPALTPLEERGCLRIIRPFVVPGLDDLKRRDHRKLLVFDGQIGWITGRNIGAPYYTGFDEVALGPDSAYRDVPWLDAGAELRGPVVQALAAIFERHWQAAAPAAGMPSESSKVSFEPFLMPSESSGIPSESSGMPSDAIPVWLVQHESMRDTRTLDTYRHLFDRARRQITVVNTFPLQFELQQALNAALSRGVAVRFLVGHVRPLFGPARTPFKGGAIRSLATEVIHGRLDALLDAGAAARGYALRDVPGWAPELGTVLPHVHAKLVSVDGERFAIGSANLDITAGYWESEALLVVEHAGETARVDATLDRLFEAAEPIDADPRWSATAARRTWVSRHWPSLLG